MKKMYTTAMGRSIDFESLKSAGEETIAVGNMKVNARGDQLGPGGVVERSRNAAMADHYNAGVSPQESLEDKMRRQKMAGASTKKSKSSKRTQENTMTESMPEENNIDQSAEQLHSHDDQVTSTTTEQILPEKRLRGSLASSIAKETTITQEKIPDPRKSKGISRI